MKQFFAALALSLLVVSSASAASLTFKSDWTIDQQGAIAQGSQVTIGYDISRLPYCRANENGYQTWDVVAHYRFDGGAIQQVSLTATHGYERIPVSALINVPFDAQNLEMWFENMDSTGCQHWDSAYGQNYWFDVVTTAMVSFNADWSETVTGNLSAGGQLTINYDASRLPTCRGYKYGIPAWSILAWYRFDGGAINYVAVASMGSSVLATLNIPANAQNLELWFENQDYYGCHAWDSMYGQNYWFSL